MDWELPHWLRDERPWLTDLPALPTRTHAEDAILYSITTYRAKRSNQYLHNSNEMSELNRRVRAEVSFAFGVPMDLIGRDRSGPRYDGCRRSCWPDECTCVVDAQQS